MRSLVYSVAAAAVVFAAVPAFARPPRIAVHGGVISRESIQRSPFGKAPDGAGVDLFTLTNRHGMVMKMMTYGATITEIKAPDRSGKMGDVILGFDTLPEYVKNSPYFGATIGRYGNRIAGGKFTLNGKTYHLAKNNGPNSLHGGKKGFDKVVWKATPRMSSAGPSIRFYYLSRNGEEGFPGTLRTTVIYTLTNDNAVRIEYSATTDRATPFNLTNHSYFNLAGKGLILDHVLWLAAHHYTPVDATLIPTGVIAPVKGTPFDFTTPTKIGARIDELKGNPGGYDHNFVLDSHGRRFSLAATAFDPSTGRVLSVYTDQPGVQFYSGNFLDGSFAGRGGQVYHKHSAFCLETQHFPDSPNHPNFPSTILRPGQRYHTITVYHFGVR